MTEPLHHEPKIVLIAPYEGLAALAKRVAREKNVEMEIVEASMEEALDVAREYERQGMDCIISRGPTGVYLRHYISIPVLLIQVTAFDILQALYQAYQLSPNLAYIDHVHRMNSYNFESILELAGITAMKHYYYCNLEMLAEQLELARAEGVEIVVGPDDDVMTQASQYGLRGEIVESTYEAVAESVGRAKELTYLREKDREANLFMKTIIDNDENALIVLDEHQNITHLNLAGEKLLGASHNRLTGKDISQLPGFDHELVQLIRGKNRLVNRVFTVKNQRVLINSIPLSYNSRFSGYIITLHLVRKIQQMEANIRRELYAKGLLARYSFDDVIGESAPLRQAVLSAQRYAAADSTVLITGESGTGKEIFAHSIHSASSRRNGPFVSVNCAAIPENLLESELFGYNEGAFTGAKRGGRTGLFELAHDGTLLLDEVSEMPMQLQARLLRVLQEKAIRRIGGESLIAVNVRILASTNQKLPDMIAEGRFRQDLFYRLNVLNLTIPPLRERPDDVITMIKHFFQEFSGGLAIPALSEEVKRCLIAYPWPGNARELENFIERLVTITAGSKETVFYEALDRLLQELLACAGSHRQLHDHPQSEHLVVRIDTLQDMEQQILTQLKKANHRNREELAARLGISRTTLWKKLKEIDSITLS